LPSVSERIRRPMDEPMLLRLVMVSGLIRGSDLAKFYSQGGGGLDGSRTLEEFLTASGVDPQQLAIVKRAYVETSDFGSTLIDNLHLRRADDQKIRAMRKALNVCETEQLLAIKRGEPPLPIGEMLVERGLLTRAELDGVLRQQGMLTKIERYTSEHRERSSRTMAERMGLGGLRARIRGQGVAVAAVAVLALVIVANFWWAGAFRNKPDLFSSARGAEDHARNLGAFYANMLAELRHRQGANAEYYRGQLRQYCERLDRDKIVLPDQDSLHIRATFAALDFDRLAEIPPRDLPRLSAADIEKRLARKP
jgi:hypothetical protein